MPALVTRSVYPSGTDSEPQAGSHYINFSNRSLLYPWVGNSLLPACSATVDMGIGYADTDLSQGCLLFGSREEIGYKMGQGGAGDNILRQSSSMLPYLKPYGY